MIDPLTKYRDALAAFAAPGGRWANKGALNYWGKAAGLSAEELIADARAAGVIDRDADIRRGWEDARPKGEAVRGAYRPRAAKPKPPRFASHIRNILDGVDAERGTVDCVRECSPCIDWINKPPEAQTIDFIRAAFAPDELLFVFRSDAATKGVPGENVRTAANWTAHIESGKPLPGDLVKINPFTGAVGKNKNGQPSYVSQDCLAAYPFALMEFDAMPLPMQYAFWRGFILSHKLAPALVSLTYSGGKSLHGLLNVGCRTLLEWQAVRRRLMELFAADTDERFRIDPQAVHPLIGTRLPGVRRRNNGVMQELIYLNPDARSGNGWIAPVPPSIDFNAPPCGSAAGKGLCGVCEHFGRCPFQDADAVRGTTLKGG